MIYHPPPLWVVYFWGSSGYANKRFKRAVSPGQAVLQIASTSWPRYAGKEPPDEFFVAGGREYRVVKTNGRLQAEEL